MGDAPYDEHASAPRGANVPGDQAEWTFQRLFDQEPPFIPALNETTVRRIVKDYRDMWHDREGTFTPACLLYYVQSKIMDPTAPLRVNDLDWNHFEELMRRQDTFLQYKLKRCISDAGIELRKDSVLMDQLAHVVRIHTAMRNYFSAMGSLYVLSQTAHSTRSSGTEMVEMVNDAINSIEAQGELETYFKHDAGKNDNFQNAFMMIRSELEGMGLRRAEDRFFDRVKTKAGLDTLAYEFKMTVQDFVSQVTDYTINYQLWRLATRPMSNLKNLEDYLANRQILEAPYLKENHHLRSFAGDSFGRGAVVYCSKSDYAFEYRKKNAWASEAAWVTAFRRKLLNDPAYVCKAPDPDDVCIAHMNCSFPYDIHRELKTLEEISHAGCMNFRECREWELDRNLTPFDSACLGARLDAELPPMRSSLGEVVGRRWRLVLPHEACDLSHSVEATLRHSEVAQLRTRCDQDVDNDVFELQEDPVDPVAPDSHLFLPSQGLYWTAVDPDQFFALPHNKIDDAAFLTVFHQRRTEQCTESSVRLHPNDLEHLHSLAPESWIACADDVVFVQLKRTLIPLFDQDMQPRKMLAPVGGVWQRIFMPPDADCVEVHDERVRHAVEAALMQNGTSLTAVCDVPQSCFVRLSNGMLMGQIGCIPQNFDGTRHYIKFGDRCFCMDTGRACFDCNTDEIDHIFRCQRFVDHDIFFLYALLGRLFFRVGELDKHQMTVLYEGYGGCGKSTIMNAMMRFFPPHKRGVLSSNVEPLFGMSQVMKGGRAEVIFCSEVATDLSLKQEEWQVSTGGEWASYAVKNGKPCVMQCIAQHFWIGNSRPGFKDDMNQMGRRLAAVLMPYPVKPRDGNIPNVIDKKLGNLLRRDVVSYHQFVRVTGPQDPMSVPAKLPPAFRDYHERCRRETDPIQDFIKDNVEVEKVEADDADGHMPLDRFKELYERYRERKNMTKVVKWVEATYRPAFNENHLYLKCVDTLEYAGATLKKVWVVYGIKERANSDGMVV